MFRFIQNWLDRRAIAEANISPAEWQRVFAGLPLLDGLSDDEQRRLRELALAFLRRKSLEGAHGMAVTREMALVIALQACLPILELGLDAYAGWTGVIVYPSGFETHQVYVDEFGVEHVEQRDLDGEAWERGPVLLAWDEAGRAGERDGFNLVIHEFAHKLDMQNGDANGFPPLPADMNPATWTEIFSKSYDDFARNCDAGVDLGLDCYAAESPAEFFAVFSEVFFERPELLDRHYPEVYRQLRQYYRQNPLSRLRGRPGPPRWPRRRRN